MDPVVYDNVIENVESSHKSAESPQRIEREESVDSDLRLLTEPGSENSQDVRRVLDFCNTVTSPVQDLMTASQNDESQTTAENVPEVGRRSQREKVVAKRFTYDTFGVPTFKPVLCCLLVDECTLKKVEHVAITLRPRQVISQYVLCICDSIKFINK